MLRSYFTGERGVIRKKRGDNLNFDYAIHSNFLIYWTGKDIDDEKWYESDKSKTNKTETEKYIKRLHNILKYGLWMTEEDGEALRFKSTSISIPKTPKTCFTELKLSESRKHARSYGRLGIGVKRPFLFERFGRPLIYYHPQRVNNDVFLKDCVQNLKDNKLLNFFKRMNSSEILNFDLYAESEWRILYSNDLSKGVKNLIIDPRDSKKKLEQKYFKQLDLHEQEKLQYLIPLDGWFSMIIYPSLDVKNEAQQNESNGIKEQIKRIKKLNDHGNKVERGNWPIEVDLDSCRNF